MKPTVFFSYSRQDSDFALKLGKDLRSSGISIWLDQLDIKPGARWDAAVEQALSQCSRSLVILSPASVGSTNVLDEVSYALEKGKLVIPVLQSDCEIPFRLRRLQHVDFRSDYSTALEELVKHLSLVPESTDGSVAPLGVPVAEARPPPRTPRPIMPALRGAKTWLIAGGAVAATLGAWAVSNRMDRGAAAPSPGGASSTTTRTPTGPTPTAPTPAAPTPAAPTPTALTPAAPTPTALTPSPATSTTSSPTPNTPSQLMLLAKHGAAKGLLTSQVNIPRARIVNAYSKLCLTIAGGVKDRNAEVVQYLCDDDPSRFWSIVSVKGTNFVWIKNLHSGLCLTIAGSGIERNTVAVQYNCDDDPSRRWKLGSDKIVNAHSKLCLTIAGSGTVRNTAAVQFPCDGDPARDWEIRPQP